MYEYCNKKQDNSKHVVFHKLFNIVQDHIQHVILFWFAIALPHLCYIFIAIAKTPGK